MITCITSVIEVDESKLMKYLEAYNSSFLYQKTGFIANEYQTYLKVSDQFIEECRKRVGNSKRYLTNGITEAAYANEWKLVYQKYMKVIKNGVVEDAFI